MSLGDSTELRYVIQSYGFDRKKISFYNYLGGVNESLGQRNIVAHVQGEMQPTSPTAARPNLDMWTVTMDYNSELDPAVVMVITAYETIRERRTMPITDSLKQFWKGIFSNPEPTSRKK
jgi:hypothetical protein